MAIRAKDRDMRDRAFRSLRDAETAIRGFGNRPGRIFRIGDDELVRAIADAAQQLTEVLHETRTRPVVGVVDLDDKTNTPLACWRRPRGEKNTPSR